MLGLTLRDEFRGKRLKGTAIELSNEANTGATQIAAQDFLEITYPTHDLLKGIEAVGPNQGRPVVVIGERGLGKSHLMAALYHAVNDSASTGAWLNSWATTIGDPQIGKIALRNDMLVIGESLHRQRYKFLWDLLFEKHPHGSYIKGKWEGMGASKTDIPSDELILELLRHTPTMLLLDEFQTWYDGLTNTKQIPWKNWAFNFIQILSEIAKEHQDLLVLVISVRNGSSDAYQPVEALIESSRIVDICCYTGFSITGCRFQMPILNQLLLIMLANTFAYWTFHRQSRSVSVKSLPSLGHMRLIF
jgi:hypothetical protein